MRIPLALLATLLPLVPVVVHAQDGRVGVEAVATALGAPA